MEQKITIAKDDSPGRAKTWLVRWYGEYDVCTGKQKRYCKGFKLRKDADLFAEEKRAEFQVGMPRDQQDITLKQLCQKFMETRPKSFSPDYRRGFEETIERLQTYFSPTTSVRMIRIEDAEAFISSLEHSDPRLRAKGMELSDSTFDRHLRQAKNIFGTAQSWGYLKTNPFEKISLGKLRKRPWYFITVDEFNAIIDKTPNLRDKALYGIMYWAGLRYGEATNLRVDCKNIDFEKCEINIFNRPATKTLPPFKVKDFESRTIPMNKWIVDMLQKLLAEKKDDCPYIFLSSERLRNVQARWQALQKARKSGDWENRFMLNGVLRNFKARCVKAGIKTDLKLNIHGLRKSWATNLANSGRVPPKTLCELGGWASIRTCEEFYLKNTDANRQRACEVLNELAGG